jgi:uncharacterized protein YbcV (DUF1398 family)
MFSLHQINDAEAKVKTGADFPAYIRDLLKIGVTEYVTFVNDGHSVFFGEEDFSIQTEEKYELLEVASGTDPEKFMQRLNEHQQGRTDFSSFCRDAAESGVARWVVDLSAMKCTYFSLSGDIVFAEQIPGSN